MKAWIGSGRTFTSPARSVTLAWRESRFELSGQRASVDESGAFAFGGLVLLAPGYANRSVTLELRAGEYEKVDVTLSK